MSTSHEPLRVIPSALKRQLRKSIRLKRPAMIWGPPGLGKSDIVKQIAIEQNRPVIDIRLLLKEASDLRGIPFYNPKTNKMEYAHPSELPDDPDSSAIIFLDEINAAPKMVMGAALQWVLDRKIGEYHLPPNCALLAAGNRESDRAVAVSMPSALANRLVHFELMRWFPDWQKWAYENGIHPDVVGYLSAKEDDLFQFNPRSASRGFQTPRTWSFVSEALWDEEFTEEMSPQQDEDLLKWIAGCVGDAAALRFMAVLRHTVKLPRAITILTGERKTIPSDLRLDVKYSLTTSLCYELKKQLKLAQDRSDLTPWFEMADNFLAFVDKNFQREMIILAVRIALKSENLPFMPDLMRNWEWFSDKYEELILEA